MTGAGKIIGRYELLDPIGHGGMAIVYLARQIDLDRQVAVKELRMFQSPDDPALAERFLREARMAGSMSHPNIVTVHEYFKHEDTPYIAMEYMQRGSLRPWIGQLSFAQIAGVLEGLLAALDHAERNRIVHRDLKPENLLVTDQGQVKVGDFGIAKARTRNTNAFLTAAGTTVGTPTYMAPEQAMAQELGPYTDLYSVGVMAYEMFVGRVPFDDTTTPVAIILRHVNERIPSAHTVNPAIDRALSDWIDRLLVKDPARRTQTAEQAWEELEEIVLRPLGSRWRRDARLLTTTEQPAARPLTPAPFTSTDAATPVPDAPSDEFESFAWGRAARALPDDARPAPAAGVEAPAPAAAGDRDVLAPASGGAREVLAPASPGDREVPTPEPEQQSSPNAEPESQPEREPEVEAQRAAQGQPEAEIAAEPQREPAGEPGRAESTPSFVTFARKASAAEPAQERGARVARAEPATPAGPPATAKRGLKTHAPDKPRPKRREAAAQPSGNLAPPPAPGESAAPAAESVAAHADLDARTVKPDAVPERPAPPARGPRPSRQIRRRRRVALAGAGAALLAVVGVVVAGGGGAGDSRTGTRTNVATTFSLSNDDLVLTLPTSWSETRPPEVPGLHPSEAVGAVRSDSYLAAELVAGTADPTLLPPKLIAALERRPKRERVTLAGLEAYRYDALRPRGSSEPLRVYAALTTEGVATIACGTADAGAAAECDRIARSLKLRSAEGLPIGPTEDYAAILKRTFASLDKRIKAVKISRTAAAQAREARQLRRAYSAASTSLLSSGRSGGNEPRKSADGSAGANPVDARLTEKLVSLFNLIARSYRQLEQAVRRNDAAAKSRAQRALDRARARFRRIISTLEDVGYSTAVRPAPPTPRRKRPATPRPRVVAPPPMVAPPQPPPPPPPPAVPPPVAAPPPAPPPPPPPGGGGGGGG